MKVLSVSKVSSVDWWYRELHIGSKPVDMTQAEGQNLLALSTPIRDALGSGLNII